MRKPKDPSNPTLADVLDKRIAMADGPLRVDEVIDYALAHRESNAKKPRANVRTKLAEMAGRNVVFLDKDTVVSQNIALRGVRESGFQAKPFAREQARQVYHFRTQARFSKNESCEIFLRGNDTLLTKERRTNK